MSAQLGRDYASGGSGGATASAVRAPREISTGALLAELAGRLDAINSHLGDCIEKIGGSTNGMEASNAATPPGTGTIHGLIEQCEQLTNSISHRVQHIHARL